MTSNDQNAGNMVGVTVLLLGSAIILAAVYSDYFWDLDEPLWPDDDSPDGDDNIVCSSINSSEVPIKITPPDSRSDPDLARWTLAQSRTTDYYGRARSGLVPPPVLSGGRFRYEDLYSRGGNVPGLRYRRRAVCPRTPRLVVVDGREDGLEGMEELKL